MAHSKACAILLRCADYFFILIGAWCCASCGTLTNGRGVGQDATLWPGAQRMKSAAYAAAADQLTWIPAASAIVVNVAGWDESVSEWATQHTPVFASSSRAADASSQLRDVTIAVSTLTLLATPGGDQTQDASIAKLKGLMVQGAATWTNTEATSALKSTVQRERPNGGNTRSFPSGHASAAFVHAGLAGQNIALLNVNHTNKRTLQAGVDLAAIGTGWARVEAGVHYPSDVLAGAALGNFFAQFFFQAFMGVDSNASVFVAPGVAARDRLIGIQVAF